MTDTSKHLKKARVHVAGLGRIGSSIVLALEAAGVGYISGNDPQRFEKEQLASCVFSRRSDIGRAKAHVLERFLDGRTGFTFEGIVAPNESRNIEDFLRQADLVISCANDLHARLHIERSAVRLRKPSIQACAQDARQSLGGLISIWTPEAHSSCFGCLMPNSPSFARGEVLMPSVTGTIANLASLFAIELLSRRTTVFVEQANVFAVDLKRQAIERLSVAEVCFGRSDPDGTDLKI